MRRFRGHFNYLSLCLGLAVVLFEIGTCQHLFADDIEIDLGGNGGSASKAVSVAPHEPAPPTSAPHRLTPPDHPSAKEGTAERRADHLNEVESKVERVVILSDGKSGARVKVEGTHLPKPSVRKLPHKILIKLAKTKLEIPSRIKGGGGLVKAVRSSMHSGMTAWMVLDVRTVKEINLSKTDTGFELLLTSSGEEAHALSPEKTERTPETKANLVPGHSEGGFFSRLVDLSIKPVNKGVKVVLTSDNPAQYTIRKLTGPEKLVIRFHNTRLGTAGKMERFKADDFELRQGGLLAAELRQIGPSFSPISETILTLVPGTQSQVDRNLNQVVITLSAPPSVEKSVQKKGDLNQLVSLDLESADLTAVVKTLGDEAGFDVDMVSGALSGVVNEKFKDVPLKTVLADILSPGNYDYDVQGNTLRVGLRADLIKTKADLPHITELITPTGGMTPVQFDALVRPILKPSNAVLSTVDPVRNVIVLNGTPSDVADYKRAIRDLKLDSGTESDRITRVVKLNYANPTDVVNILTPYLTPVGKVQVDTRTNNLVVWDTASNMGVLLELIKELDVRLPQVLIEANIVEVDDEKDLNLGIAWQVGRTTGDPTMTATYLSPSGAPSSGSLGFGTIKSGLNINATLSALEARNKAKIISRPRVATASGVAAEMNTIEKVVYSTVSTIYNGNIATQTTTFAQLPLPIDLKVKPYITDDGRISSAVTVTVTSQTGPAVSAGGSTSPPPTSEQTANTTMTTKNGETIVIGGLERDTVQDNVQGIPLLSSLPIIGSLFQNKSYKHQRVELVIFITQTILED